MGLDLGPVGMGLRPNLIDLVEPKGIAMGVGRGTVDDLVDDLEGPVGIAGAVAIGVEVDSRGEAVARVTLRDLAGGGGGGEAERLGGLVSTRGSEQLFKPFYVVQEKERKLGHTFRKILLACLLDSLFRTVLLDPYPYLYL